MDEEDEDDFIESVSADTLRRIMGDDGFLALTEAYGGLRTFIPSIDRLRGTKLCDDITFQHAEKLSRVFPSTAIPVPLAREFRARMYLDKGYSNRKIARLLGITENGIVKMKQRFKASETESEAEDA